MNYTKSALLVALLVAIFSLAPSVARAQTCIEKGSSSESGPGQWEVGLGLDLPTPCSFQKTFTFDKTVRTRKVHVSYNSTCTDSVLFFVKLPDGRFLFGPLTMLLTVPSNTVELSVNNKKVNSISVFLFAGCNGGGFEVQLLGTDIAEPKR